jgi:MFS superfamily sulfate permease-like transporter
MKKPIWGNLKYDLPSSLVVFFVAVPLCLGIALASGAPFFSGLIAGIVGGIIIGSLSNSQLSVSGPAAGLTAIVLAGINKLGAFETFLVAVFLAGAIQLLLGFLRAGSIANYFPSSVIKGMLTAIGIIIILKQIPHAVGYKADTEGFCLVTAIATHPYWGNPHFVNFISHTHCLGKAYDEAFQNTPRCIACSGCRCFAQSFIQCLFPYY